MQFINVQNVIALIALVAMVSSSPIQMDNFETVEYMYDGHHDIDVTRQSANPKGVKFDKADLFKEFNVSDLEVNDKDIDITRQSANPNKKPFENMDPFEGF